MDPLEAFLLGYVLIVLLFLAGSLALFLTGNPGRLSRALLISALTGILVPGITYFAFPYFVPMPHSTPPVIDPNTATIPQLIADAVQGFFEMGKAVGYDLDRAATPFWHGFLGMILVFPLSFAIPHRPALSEPISQPV